MLRTPSKMTVPSRSLPRVAGEGWDGGQQRFISSGARKIIFLLALVAVAAMTTGCAQPPAQAGATAVYLIEREPDFEPTRTRMIVTPQFLRIDDGRDGGDFLLYHRGERIIYNVSASDALILVIGPQAVAAAPVALEHRIEPDGAGAPNVSGKKVRHYRLLTNSETCYDLYAADGLLPEVVTALREYRESLAGEHAQALAFTPKEMQTPCDLANNIYAPARHLAHGFPIRVDETSGRDQTRVRTTELLDYQQGFAANDGLFQLPDYRRMTIQELRRR